MRDNIAITKSDYIADSVIASYFTHDANEVSFYPILDHLGLLLQRAIDVNISVVSRGIYRRVFSNSQSEALVQSADFILDDPVRRRAEAIQIPKPQDGSEDDVYILIRGLIWSESTSSFNCEPLNIDDMNATRRLFGMLTSQSRPNIYRLLASAPRREWPPKYCSVMSEPDRPLMTTAKTEDLVGKISLKLDYLYQSLSISKQLQRTLKKELSNIFCVIRYVDEKTSVRLGRFPYSTRMVLSKSQRAAIDDAPDFLSMSRSSDIKPSALLEEPLGPNARSIADAIFESGSVEFPAESFGKGRDTAHRRLESRLLSGYGSRLMHVPIHVGGLPWAVFFLILPEHDEELAWWWIARFYRACVPLLGDGLRRIIRRQFFDQVAAIVEASFKNYFCGAVSLLETLAAANAQIVQICGFFPYVPPVISLEPSTKRGLKTEEGIDIKIGDRLLKLRAGADGESPFKCFSSRLLHDRLRSNEREFLEFVVAGVERASAAHLTAQAARAAFAGALAHDVKNTTNDIIQRLTSSLGVFKNPEIRASYHNAAADLVCANLRALQLNSVAMSINTLFLDGNSLARVGQRRFSRDAIGRFWTAIFRFLLQARSFSESAGSNEDGKHNACRVVIAPSLPALSSYFDSATSDTAINNLWYPTDWLVGKVTAENLNAEVRRAMESLNLEGGLSEGLADYRIGLALAMLSEIIANIRLNRPLKSGLNAGEVLVAFDLRWHGSRPVMLLQQLHWEAIDSEWEPPVEVPKGIGRTLSLFGPGPGALKVMTTTIAHDPLCRNAMLPHYGVGGRLFAYALEIGLDLLQARQD